MKRFLLVLCTLIFRTLADELFEVTLTSLWTRADVRYPYPLDYPTNAHWSSPVWMTGDQSFTFWEVGQMASPGMKSLAETGSTGALKDELEAKGVKFDVAGGIQDANDKSDTSVFTIAATRQTRPFLTVATMVAPSPDWFSGVSKVSLYNEDGTPLRGRVYNCVAYDAGTDSGTTYTSDNSPTTPAVAIANRVGVGPFAQSIAGVVLEISIEYKGTSGAAVLLASSLGLVTVVVLVGL